jgi:hypothetical protein
MHPRAPQRWRGVDLFFTPHPFAADVGRGDQRSVEITFQTDDVMQPGAMTCLRLIAEYFTVSKSNFSFFL